VSHPDEVTAGTNGGIRREARTILAKRRASHMRHTKLWVGLWVGTF